MTSAPACHTMSDMQTEPTERISFRVPKWMRVEMEREAKREETTLSRLIRLAWGDYKRNRRKK